MKNKLMIGIWGHMVSVPPFCGRRRSRRAGKRSKPSWISCPLITERCIIVLVRELPRVGKPMAPESVASELDLSPDRVNAILDDLEKHMTFLFRNEEGAVVWAYPVTVEKTPHHLAFNTGEQLYAA